MFRVPINSKKHSFKHKFTANSYKNSKLCAEQGDILALFEDETLGLFDLKTGVFVWFWKVWVGYLVAEGCVHTQRPPTSLPSDDEGGGGVTERPCFKDATLLTLLLKISTLLFFLLLIFLLLLRRLSYPLRGNPVLRVRKKAVSLSHWFYVVFLRLFFSYSYLLLFLFLLCHYYLL